MGFGGFQKREFRQAVSWLSVAMLLTACAQGNPDRKVVKDCVVPQDQTGTISGHWAVTPVPVALHAGEFTNDEVAAVAKAMDSWNNFYSASLGLKTINYLDANGKIRTSSQAKPAALCSQSILKNGQFSGPVVIYKSSPWPYGSRSTAIALTSFCPNAASPLPAFYMAVMELNYQSFFVAGKKLPDMESIVLHELGHLMGLDHSCESPGRNGMPDCNASDLPSNYLTASMAPIFNFDTSGLGEIKRLLTDNDQGRANCLYKGSTGSTAGGN